MVLASKDSGLAVRVSAGVDGAQGGVFLEHHLRCGPRGEEASGGWCARWRERGRARWEDRKRSLGWSGLGGRRQRGVREVSDSWV